MFARCTQDREKTFDLAIIGDQCVRHFAATLTKYVVLKIRLVQFETRHSVGSRHKYLQEVRSEASVYTVDVHLGCLLSNAEYIHIHTCTVCTRLHNLAPPPFVLR